MIGQDSVISELAGANPVPRSAKPGPDDRLQADRVLNRVLSTPRRPRRRLPVLAPLASALAVVAVVAVAFTIGGSGPKGAPGSRGLRIVLQAQPTGQTAVTPAALSREVTIVGDRLATVSSGLSVTSSGADGLAITGRNVGAAERSRLISLVTQPGRLHVYDWETSVLMPSGKTVASQLRAQNPAALTISQGSGATAPGEPGAGALPLYQAVELASRQPRPKSPQNTHLGPQYYVFGTPGSAACAEQARAYGTLPIAGEHCLLAGPISEPLATSRRQAIRGLAAQLPPNIPRTDRKKVLVIQQGAVVLLQAMNKSAAQEIAFGSPVARFYVLRAQAELDGADVSNPQQSTDQSGMPDITFSFTAAGARRFQHATAEVARRGQQLSTLGQTLDQHFAIAIDNRLLTVPSIDFKTYPDGITGDEPADITGGLTKQSARELVTQLRFGPLPLNLRLVR